MISLKFTSSESLINGYFFPAITESVIATVVFLQGFPGVEGDELICERMAQSGVNVLTFNYRGTFQSEGYFSFTNVIADIGAALLYVKGSEELGAFQIDPEKIVLGGWSLGGAMVPAGAVQNPQIRRLFTIAGRNFGKEAGKIDEDPVYADQVARNLESLRAPVGPVNFRDDLIHNLLGIQDWLDYEKLAPQLKDHDLLLIGGWDDDIVPIEEHVIPLYRSLQENGAESIRIMAVQDGHEFSITKDQIVQIIVNWLKEE